MVFIDIETIPTQDAAEIERIAADERARNAALAKPHSEAKLAENIDELVRKTALDGASGEVVCVAARAGLSFDVAPQIWARDYRVANSEAGLLDEVLAWLAATPDAELCGHNVLGFDVPFLRQRAFVHGLALPAALRTPPKPWAALTRDTMALWTGGQPGKGISLDRLCRTLGVPGKGELDGAGVWDAVRAGRIDEVARYCAADVDRAQRCWGRMMDSFAEVSAQGQGVAA